MLILTEPITKKFERTTAEHNHDLLLLIFIFVLLLLLLLLLVFVLILRRLLLFFFFFFFLLLFPFLGKIILIILNPRLEIRKTLRADTPAELFQILKDTLRTDRSVTKGLRNRNVTYCSR